MGLTWWQKGGMEGQPSVILSCVPEQRVKPTGNMEKTESRIKRVDKFYFGGIGHRGLYRTCCNHTRSSVWWHGSFAHSVGGVGYHGGLKCSDGAGDMAQWLLALAEDTGSIPNGYMDTHM